MNPHTLNRQLDRVARRMFRYRLLRSLSLCWLLAAMAGVVGLMFDVQLQPSSVSWSHVFTAVVGLSSVLAAVLIGRYRVSRLDAARAIERDHPELQERLLAAAELTPDPQTGELRYLQQELIGEVLVHRRQHDWLQVIPRPRFLAAAGLHGASLLLILAVLLAGALSDLSDPTPASIPNPTSVASQSVRDYGLTVEPGDTAIERGTPLLVLARFAETLPQDVKLEYTDEETHEVALTKSLDDPLFGGRIENVVRDLAYRIAYDGHQSREFQVTVFDYPELQRADATVTFPDYTGLPSQVIEDVRRLSAVEGSSVTLTCKANKPIVSARLLDEDQQPIALKPLGDRDDTFEVTLPLEMNQRPGRSTYRLELVDAEGRRNKSAPEFVFEVNPNRRPDLKLTFPGKDLRVSPLEEIPLEAAVWDDFGLAEYGLIYTLAGQEPVTVMLGDSPSGEEPRQISRLLALEELDAEPNQLLAYYFYADDVGPDGRKRRTFSDMYFAEVRPFEEIFRQGQQPPGGGGMQGGGGQNGQDVEQLVRLQKDIVNATWKVYRREDAAIPGVEFPHDVRLIADSQQAAVKQVQELGGKLTDPNSQRALRTAGNHMSRAAESLRTAEEHARRPPLSQALDAEQAAYQSLLQLRAREHQVVQSQSGGGGGQGGGNRSQQQLQQLELSNHQNRYESNKQADQPPSLAQREQRQVLNRLRELARRQSGVNQKLKELQLALQEAKTEQEQEEIRRRLKRLREEQQKLLRDLDELRNRMNRPENQQQMAEDRRRLEETRSRVRQSSEALEQGRVSKALSSGTRAERELQQLRDEFRRRTAGQFADAMQQLRNQARETSDEQQRLAEQFRKLHDPSRRSLRDSRDRRELADDFHRQQERLDNVFDHMRRVIRQAEGSEPHLSEKLYETVRKTRTEQPRESLEAASDLLNRGLLSEADRAERQARKGIEVLRAGIEEAAEAVLGDETEALKLAQNELKNLTQSVAEELAQAQRAVPQPLPRAPMAEGSGQIDRAGDDSRQRTTDQSQNRQDNSRQPDRSSEPNQSQGRGSQAGEQGDRSSEPSQNNRSQEPTGGEHQTASSQSSPSAGKGTGRGQPGLKGSSRSQAGSGSPQRSAGTQDGLSGGPGGGEGAVIGPLTGSGFQQWSDRMRDVEEMVDDPQLRADVARIRERARSIRAEFKRHSKEPNWPLVRTSVFEPLVELQMQIAEEIARRESPDALVPIDRDPVPDTFSDLVRRYYERLGSGK